MLVACAVCTAEFEARRSTARYCGDRCRQLAKRKRDQAVDSSSADQADHDASKPTVPANPGLIAAVRKKLEAAKRLDTVEGQMALVLAGQAAAHGATGVPGLIKELRTAMNEALAGTAPTEPVVEDQLAKARKARDRKAARQAADRA